MNIGNATESGRGLLELMSLTFLWTQLASSIFSWSKIMLAQIIVVISKNRIYLIASLYVVSTWSRRSYSTYLF